MQNIIVQLTQSVGQFFTGLFNGLFIEPVKTLYFITMEYIIETDLDPIALTGLILAYFLIAYAGRAAFLLEKFIVQYFLLRYREKRRAEIRAERKRA